jgi:SAM-dependent methyltransferase
MVRGSQADWENHWRTVYEARASQQQRVRGRQGDYWGRRAEVFSRRIGAPDGALDLLLKRIQHGDTVLDVGAGAGRYAIPAAARAKEVIAVEPSIGMGKALVEEAEKRRVRNIRLVESDWLAADVAPADLVFCAHVLYFTPEAAAFIKKLDAHTLRECVVVIRIDQGGAGLGPLYEEILGEPQAPEPSFIDLYNLLYAMGIVANVTITEGTNSMSRFESLEQAEATVTASLAPPDEASRAKIRPFLESNLVPWHDGGLTFPGGGLRIAVLSWTKDNRKPG